MVRHFRNLSVVGWFVNVFVHEQVEDFIHKNSKICFYKLTNLPILPNFLPNLVKIVKFANYCQNEKPFKCIKTNKITNYFLLKYLYSIFSTF